jgi:hypothetical protein
MNEAQALIRRDEYDNTEWHHFGQTGSRYYKCKREYLCGLTEEAKWKGCDDITIFLKSGWSLDIIKFFKEISIIKLLVSEFVISVVSWI